MHDTHRADLIMNTVLPFTASFCKGDLELAQFCVAAPFLPLGRFRGCVLIKSSRSN